MKKLALLSLLFVTLLTSCTIEDDCCCEQQTTTQYQLFTCDTQDNVIKINNQWLTNSNLDASNWQYLQSVGFRLQSPNFTISVNDGRKILQAELFNFPYPVSIHRPNDHTVVFYSTQMSNYINDTDLFYVNLKLTVN